MLRTTFIFDRTVVPLGTSSRRYLRTSERRVDFEKPHSSTDLIQLEDHYSAHNYHPLPVVFSRAKGVKVWDPEGKEYFDFLSAYSAVNQGHCHPRIVATLVEQAQKLTLSSRAFHNDQFPLFAAFITAYFDYESVLPANSGVEAVESAMKISRKWGYEKKGIPDNQAQIVFCSENFHGRTLGVIAASTDQATRRHFGPPTPGILVVPYNNVEALRALFKEKGDRIAAFVFEPIQGEAGVVVPDDGYYKAVRALCTEYNVLMVADEIQSGLARAGTMLAVDREFVRPDLVVLGKALSGGVYPISAVLADKEIMDVLTPGTHGSTFGGNPIASAVARTALRVIEEEGLVENSRVLGDKFRVALRSFKERHSFIKTVRGRGLLNALVIDEEYPKSAWDLCLIMAKNGLLAKPTHEHIIRLAPPLVMTHAELDQCTDIMERSLKEFAEK